jgi:hypothetical protein
LSALAWRGRVRINQHSGDGSPNHRSSGALLGHGRLLCAMISDHHSHYLIVVMAGVSAISGSRRFI